MKDKSIFIKNIYYMLAYALEAVDMGEYRSMSGEKFDNIHSLLAAVLARGIGVQLKRGLYREYIDHTENISGVRGKINLQNTARSKIARKKIISCEFDELSENNIFNKIIKTTAIMLIRCCDTDIKYKSELKKEMLFFSEIDTIDPLLINWGNFIFQRNNRGYRVLMGICRFALEGMLLTDDHGKYRLTDFFSGEKMERLYEKFILKFYMKERPELNASASKIKWALDDNYSEMLPEMKSDVMLSYGGRTLIIDAKYYTRATREYFGVKKIHSDNLYQIFTYVKNKSKENNIGDVAGMLLYAGTDEPVQPDNKYMMSGNSISVRMLDLNRDFNAISGQLNDIADEYFFV